MTLKAKMAKRASGHLAVNSSENGKKGAVVMLEIKRLKRRGAEMLAQDTPQRRKSLKHKNYAREWRKRRMEAGMCVRCGLEPARTDRTTCAQCAEQIGIRKKHLRSTAKRCLVCRKFSPGADLCDACTDVMRTTREQYEREAGR